MTSKEYFAHRQSVRQQKWQGTTRYRAKAPKRISGIIARGGTIEQVHLETVFNKPGWTKYRMA